MSSFEECVAEAVYGNKRKPQGAKDNPFAKCTAEATINGKRNKKKKKAKKTRVELK